LSIIKVGNPKPMKRSLNRISTLPTAISFLTGLFTFAFFYQSLAQPEIRNGLKFTGNNYVDCGNSAANLFDLTGEGTIEAWVKITKRPPAANSTTFYSIAAKDEGPGENNKWIFGVQNGKLVFHTNSPGKSLYVPFSELFTLYSQPFTLELNKYYFFAVTKDKNGFVTFYINGVNMGSSYLKRAIPSVNAPLLIGNAEPGFSINGEIYEVRFWHKALKEQEIKQWMYAKPNTSHPDYASLAASFHLSEKNETIESNQNKIVATIKNIQVLYKPYLPRWIIVLNVALVIVILLCFFLYRMQRKISNEKTDMELFAAQMLHENNNSIGMIINVLSYKAIRSGFDGLETQLKHRLETIANLQSLEYIVPGEKLIAFKKYITNLVDKMDKAFNLDKQIDYKIDLPEYIKANFAFKLTVLIRELTLNSLKHAFTGRVNGEINISIKHAKNGFSRFDYSDNGIGIEEGKLVSASVGTALINSVSSQLGGKPDIFSVNGYKFSILFKS